jgi:DNA-binding MarR family transcriptional regulator
LKHSQKLYLKLSEEVREKYSISQSEFDIVAFLNNHPQFNTAKNICEVRLLPKSCVSVALDRLTKMGYIACSADEQDRRVVRLRFLEKAEPLRKAIKLVQVKFGCAVFENISQEEAGEFFNTLSKINENVVDAMEEAKA